MEYWWWTSEAHFTSQQESQQSSFRSFHTHHIELRTAVFFIWSNAFTEFWGSFLLKFPICPPPLCFSRSGQTPRDLPVLLPGCWNSRRALPPPFLLLRQSHRFFNLAYSNQDLCSFLNVFCFGHADSVFSFSLDLLSFAISVKSAFSPLFT